MRSKLYLMMLIALTIGLMAMPGLSKAGEHEMKKNSDDIFTGWFGGWFDSDGFLQGLDEAEPLNRDQYTADEARVTVPIPAGWNAYLFDGDNLVAVSTRTTEDAAQMGYDTKSKSEMQAASASMNEQDQKEMEASYEKHPYDLDRAAFSMFVEGRGSYFKEYSAENLSDVRKEELKEEVTDALKEETGADKVNIADVRNVEVKGHPAIVMQGTLSAMGDDGEDSYNNTVYARLYMFPTGNDEVVHVIYVSPEQTWKQMEKFADHHIKTIQVASASMQHDKKKMMKEGKQEMREY